MLTLMMTSCGPDSAHYALSGHLLNMNQGVFLIYSPDGAISRVDTAYVEGGRFDVEGECTRQGTLCIIMPSGMEMPVFIQPGGSVSVEGNAQDLKNVEIKGLEENALMSKFRKEIAKANYAQIVGKVMEYVNDNPTSIVSTYLIRRYLLGTETPDYAKALKAIAVMRKAEPDNQSLKMMEMDVKDLQNADVGAKLPDLHLVDIDGKTVSDAALRKGICIFTTVVSYDYESTSQMRQIKDRIREYDKSARIVVISIDASKSQCRNIMNNDDKNTFTFICDEKMADTPAAQKLMAVQPGTVVIAKDGKIVKRDLTGDQLYKYLKSL